MLYKSCSPWIIGGLAEDALYFPTAWLYLINKFENLDLSASAASVPACLKEVCTIVISSELIGPEVFIAFLILELTTPGNSPILIPVVLARSSPSAAIVAKSATGSLPAVSLNVLMLASGDCLIIFKTDSLSISSPWSLAVFKKPEIGWPDLSKLIKFKSDNSSGLTFLDTPCKGPPG